MKNYSKIIGIDISKNSLDICELNAANPKEMHHSKILNDPKTISKLLKRLDKETTLFCMEDTGIYGMLLYRGLSEKQFDFSVVSALRIKRSKGLQRGKSDRTDARDIAHYALTHLHTLTLYELPESDLQEVKVLHSEREKLVKTIEAFESTQETTVYADKTVCKGLNKVNRQTIKLLQKQLQKIEAMIGELIQNNGQMSHQNELLQSIPGIGPQTALLIVYTRCFTCFDNRRQFACYSGVAPFPYQSGISVNGQTKVSHFAQKKLKSVIHLAALSARRYDTELNQYFERKVAEGKNKMLVLNAIRCKLIARAFAVIKRQTPYVNTKKYAA